MPRDACCCNPQRSGWLTTSRFIRGFTENRQKTTYIDTVSRLYKKLSQETFFSGDHAKIGDGRTVLRKACTEINLQVEQLVTHLYQRIGRDVAAFDRPSRHVWVDFGEPQFKQHKGISPFARRAFDGEMYFGQFEVKMSIQRSELKNSRRRGLAAQQVHQGQEITF